MTLKQIEGLLAFDGYKKLEVISDVPTLHTLIIIKGGRLRKPSKSIMYEFYMRIPIIVRLELRREISIFGKRVNIWNISNAARLAFEIFGKIPRN